MTTSDYTVSTQPVPRWISTTSVDASDGAIVTLQPSDLIALPHYDLLQFRYLARQLRKPSFGVDPVW